MTIWPSSKSNSRSGFTLIELLVVVAIITLLLAILVPTLARARDNARSTVNLANLKGVGFGVAMYTTEHDGYFFVHEGNYNAPAINSGPGTFDDAVKASSGTFTDAADLIANGITDAATANKSTRRSHWVDYVFEYATSPKFYLSPMLNDAELKNFTLDFVKEGTFKRAKWGGYGYNFQFLGRAWSATTPAYRARINSPVLAPSNTVVIGDCAGSRKGAAPPGGLMANSYVLDPPLYTTSLGAVTGKYYQGVDAGTSDADLAATPLGSTNWRYRCFPAPRNNGRAGFVFADGHAETKLLKEIDDFNGDGVYDNGYWNGYSDTSPSGR